MVVSIHAPAKGATNIVAAGIDARNMFQSTRPRRARPLISKIERPLRLVSIHAPAKGATRTLAEEKRRREVSIHAPAKGATRRDPLQSQKENIVSIHAPAKGATECPLLCWTLPTCFNPRAREGRDLVLLELWGELSRFNPRAREGRDTVKTLYRNRRNVSIHAPAKGATALWLFQVLYSGGFNPRAREGRDRALQF